MLSERDLGHLKYLSKLALQPAHNWEGFYRTPNEGMNFGLRFQIAFAGYAAYGLARQTPAYRAPYAAILKALIERMARQETWAYWLLPALRVRQKEAEPSRLPGQLQGAVEVVHSRLGVSNLPL